VASVNINDGGTDSQGHDGTTTSALLSFPERPVEGSSWTQVMPWGELTIEAGRTPGSDGSRQTGVPYGDVPGLLLQHIEAHVRRASEAGENPSRIDLGNVLSTVARELDLEDGIEDDELQDQANAMFVAQYTVTLAGSGVTMWFHLLQQMPFGDPASGDGWDAVLSEDYVNAILDWGPTTAG